MKETGIIRRVDELGRIVLPIELRRDLDINAHDRVEMYVEENRIILKKYSFSCIFCGSEKELREYRGKRICARCARAVEGL